MCIHVFAYILGRVKISEKLDSIVPYVRSLLTNSERMIRHTNNVYCTHSYSYSKLRSHQYGSER